MMILSVTEVDDKPLKYSLMFLESRVLIISKTDLLLHVDCSAEKIRASASKLNQDRVALEMSCRTGANLDNWMA